MPKLDPTAQRFAFCPTCATLYLGADTKLTHYCPKRVGERRVELDVHFACFTNDMGFTPGAQLGTARPSPGFSELVNTQRGKSADSDES